MSKSKPRAGWIMALAACSAIASVAEGGTPLTTKLVTGGLSNPIEVTYAPGDFHRVFVLERAGYVRIIKDGVLLPTAFLDIHTQVDTASERGLIGIAFHPQYQSNGLFYVRYNNFSTQTVVARYAVSAGNADIATAGSAQTVLTINNSAGNHNGGSIEFSPIDGYLYIAVGDNAASGNAQDITSELHGKILRIDVNSDSFPDPNRNYAIPSTNPYIGVTGDDEIWAIGLRNPFRAAFDRVTGDYWIGDVGDSSWEEIDFQPAGIGGRNYGWGCMEGFHCASGGGCTCNAGNLTLPIYEYSHGLGCAITGGRVYRGCAIPDLQGTYFYADYCTPHIWSLDYVNGVVTNHIDRYGELDPPGANIDSIVAFGADAYGELYICDLQGQLFKIIPAAPPQDNNGNGVADSCESPMPGDVTGDGLVNIDDLLAVIGEWGPCPPPCPADQNGNGVVNIDDLLAVVNHWS